MHKIVEQVDKINSLVAASKIPFTEYLKNKDFPLEDRWAALCKYGELMLEIDGFIIHLQELKNAGVEDDELFDYRHEVWPFERVIYAINDRLEDNSTYYVKYHTININRLKEEMLETGYLGFTHDW